MGSTSGCVRAITGFGCVAGAGAEFPVEWMGAIPGVATPSIVLLGPLRGTTGDAGGLALACSGAMPGRATPIIVPFALGELAKLDTGAGAGAAAAGGEAAA